MRTNKSEIFENCTFGYGVLRLFENRKIFLLDMFPQFEYLLIPLLGGKYQFMKILEIQTEVKTIHFSMLNQL